MDKDFQDIFTVPFIWLFFLHLPPAPFKSLRPLVSPRLQSTFPLQTHPPARLPQPLHSEKNPLLCPFTNLRLALRFRSLSSNPEPTQTSPDLRAFHFLIQNSSPASPNLVIWINLPVAFQ
jgi:hypothetical protein